MVATPLEAVEEVEEVVILQEVAAEVAEVNQGRSKSHYRNYLSR